MFDRIKTWLGGAQSPASASPAPAPSDDAARTAFRQALQRYPAHAAPHPGYAQELTPEQAQANLDWFLGSLPDRLQVLDVLLAEFGVPAQPAADTPEARQAWIGQLIDWTRRCWPAQPYRPEHLATDDWLRLPRTGDDAIFSVTLDLATRMGEVVRAACPDWRWGLDMSAASLRGPMLTSRRVVLTTAPLGPQGVRLVRDWEVAVVLRYQNPQHFLFEDPLSNDAWSKDLEAGATGRVIRLHKDA